MQSPSAHSSPDQRISGIPERSASLMDGATAATASSHRTNGIFKPEQYGKCTLHGERHIEDADRRLPDPTFNGQQVWPAPFPDSDRKCLDGSTRLKFTDFT